MADNVIAIDPVENAALPAINAGTIGLVVTITTTIDNIDEVVDAGFQRLVLERSSDGGLSYSEITTPDMRPVLEKGKTVYTLRDRKGAEEYFYRTRYIATAGSLEGTKSDPSEAIIGAGLATRNILTVAELKARYFFGTDITDNAGNPLSDAVFLHYILNAIRWFEHQLDIPILPQTFCDLHDYHRGDYDAFVLIQLDNYPAISVEEFRVQYPSGQNVITYPEEWFRLDKSKGMLQVVPTAGTLAEVFVGAGGSFLPAIYNGMSFLPQLFQVEYTAGFEEGKVPRNIVDLIGMFAALGPFNIFGDLIAGAGIATISLSMDGLSQNIGTTSSATNSGYGSRIIQYQKQIKEQIPILRRYYKGIRGVVA